MSTTAPTTRRLWLALSAAGLSLALGAGLLAYVLVQGGADVLPRVLEVAREDAPPQARWRTKVFAVGATTKRQRAWVRAQGPRIERAVQQLYEPLFLDPERARPVIAKLLPGRAGRRFVRSGAGVSGEARVRTLRRIADIAVYSRGARQASAEVVVVARAAIGERRMKIVHRATLWLVRRGRRWNVIAFDVRQSQGSRGRAA